MSDPTKAVFLSYASQDVEAAKKICEALRSSGVEVWFDAEGGLEHGDEWDAKIRRQIKECVLFIPVISANTEAREEGYFRIEWDLAAERARGIASGVAFILPVVVDDTREPDALVPDRFRAVQWTKLHGGVIPPEVKQRFLKLWSHRAGVVKHAAENRGQRTSSFAPFDKLRASEDREDGGQRAEDRDQTARAAVGKPGVKTYAALAACVAVLVALVGWWFGRGNAAQQVSAGGGNQAATAPESEAQQLVAKIWAQLNKTELARAELDVADGLGKRATELELNNAAAWAAWSQVDSWFVYHGLDDTRVRRESARTKAARALQLAPESYEARLAQACFLVRSAGGLGKSSSLYDAEAQILLTTLLRENPAEPRALLALGILQRNTGQAAEGRATLEKLAENPSFSALAWNEIAWAAYIVHDYRAADTAVKRSIALQACWPNLLLKMLLAERWSGDLDLAKATMEKIPIAVRQEDLGVAMSCQLYWARREPDNLLRALEGVSRDWLASNAFDGPKAFWVGLAHEMAGRKEAARVQWQQGLNQVETRLMRQPDSGNLLAWKGVFLAKLGRPAEAEQVMQLARESGVGPGDYRGAAQQINNQILLGNWDEAVALWEASSPPVAASRGPLFDPIRSHPRFQAALARMEKDPRLSPNAADVPIAAVPKPDEKLPAK